ncbi:hypothetical protein D3Z51_09580 [Clostridiaceae bacterium]|nr:hypothetical protein [Clostridiaceae bacterium]RKI14100.1 hypothetical protein D7V81_09065 [bacterium 1XD21-70]
MEEKNFEFDSWNPEDRDESAYEAYFSVYAEPYPILNGVDNTPENRQRYILDGVETGWVSE